jgi:hypothetical protein
LVHAARRRRVDERPEDARFLHGMDECMEFSGVTMSAPPLESLGYRFAFLSANVLPAFE